MLDRGALGLLLEGLALRGAACNLGGAEPLLRLLRGGAQRLPCHLERKETRMR